MTLPLHLFAGWLLFFYVSCWLGVILVLFNCYTVIATIVRGVNTAGLIFYLVLLADQIVAIILLSRILKIVKIKEMNIPDRVVRLFTWIAMLSLGFAILETILIYLLFGGSASSEFTKELGQNVGRTLVSWAIWSSYFMKSQRVSSYYGRGSSKLLKF